MYETRLPVQASAEETGSLQWEGGVGDRHSFFAEPPPTLTEKWVCISTDISPSLSHLCCGAMTGEF